jgi:methylamine---glutamate N-methyltransferase subunit B
MKMIDAKNKDLKVVNSELKESMNGKPVKVKNVSHLHGLAAGFKHGEVVIQGDVGDYVGVLNAGATIRVTKNAARYVADNMTAGTVIIDGNADYGTGQYCYGGLVIVRGDSGDFTATMNKGATIIVCGDVGDEVGTYMLKGDLIVLGNAGKHFANYLIRGNVYIGGQWKSIGNNTKVEPLTDEDKAKLRAYFEMYQIETDLVTFKKIVAASERPFYH